jgi:hypothetical protein
MNGNRALKVVDGQLVLVLSEVDMPQTVPAFSNRKVLSFGNKCKQI